MLKNLGTPTNVRTTNVGNDKRQNDKRQKGQTSERTNVGSDKRRKRQTSERQTSEATNVGSDKHQKITKFNSVNFCHKYYIRMISRHKLMKIKNIILLSLSWGG